MNGKCNLVTGADGFVGRHLVARLRRDEESQTICTTLGKVAGAQVCDLRDRSAVNRLLQDITPSRIYHCAGTFTDDWEIDFAANVQTAHNLFEAVVELNLPCRILLMGTAAEYGWPAPGPVPETAPVKPISVYGLTKSFQTRLMDYYHRKNGLDIVMARLFNLFGEGCSPLLFPGRVLDQIKKIKSGQSTRITVGPLDSKRDYISVEQAVDALIKIMKNGKSGEIYNVGSGVPVKLSDFLAQLLAVHGLTMNVVDIETAANRGRRNDVTEIYADISKLKALG